MATKRHRLVMEYLELRQLLAASVMFEDSGQHLGTNTYGLEFGDLDGDGDLDAIVGCRNFPGGPSCSQTQVWLNDGRGQFSVGWSSQTQSIAVALGDLDHDGDLDAFFGKASPAGSQPNEVWLNDGQGNLEDSGQRLKDIARDVTLGDVDNDGDLDAVTATLAGPSKVWLNDGRGKFADSGQRLTPDGWSYAVALGDVDRDGDLDAWFGRGTESPSFVDLLYLNDGKGNFVDSGQRLNTVSTTDVEFADLDGDGDLDAYLANGNSLGGNVPDRVWLNNGTGKFTDSGQRLGRSLGRSVEIGDLDGDGDLDALVANGSIFQGAFVEQANEVWLNDGSGVFTAGQQLGNAATNRVVLGDIDNDDDLDALFANLGQDNQVWFNTQPIAGDANRDGEFDSADLILVFSAGEYEDGIPRNSTFDEGDWNNDGDFDSSDMILAFQHGKYVASTVAGATNQPAAPMPKSLVKKQRGSETDGRVDNTDTNADRWCSTQDCWSGRSAIAFAISNSSSQASSRDRLQVGQRRS